jgi:hypothetical protein
LLVWWLVVVAGGGEAVGVAGTGLAGVGAGAAAGVGLAVVTGLTAAGAAVVVAAAVEVLCAAVGFFLCVAFFVGVAFLVRVVVVGVLAAACCGLAVCVLPDPPQADNAMAATIDATTVRFIALSSFAHARARVVGDACFRRRRQAAHPSADRVICKGQPSHAHPVIAPGL